jgi:hypothetical protein
MEQSELIARWQRWIEKEIGGPRERMEAARREVMAAIREGKSRDEIAVRATRAANRPFSGDGGAQQFRNAQNDAAYPPPNSEPGFRGIYDVVASDKSELGRSTLAALQSVEMHKTLSTKSFLSLANFRGKYGFEGGRAISLSSILIAAIILSILMGNLRVPVPGPFGFGLIIAVLLVILIFRITFVLVVTPLIAKRTKVEIADGRIMITYGLFSTRQLVSELHWIREVGWSQSFLQKMLNEGTIWINFDTASRGVVRQIIPGLVPVSEMQNFVNKIRNVAQKLRQGNYYARSFIG